MDATRVQGKIQGILLPNDSKMVNNKFAHDYLLSIRVDQGSVSSTRGCLSIFCNPSRSEINDHKTNYWLFGAKLSPTTMWDWCLECLQRKLLLYKNKDLSFTKELTIVSRII